MAGNLEKPLVESNKRYTIAPNITIQSNLGKIKLNEPETGVVQDGNQLLATSKLGLVTKK